MGLLIAGVALWWAAHLFKRIAPGARARLGGAGKGLVGLVLVASVVMMVYGYRWAPQVDIWYPPAWLVPVNNLLMLGAVYLYAASGLKTRITRVIRHPQLTAVKIWAVAHLLVNGDVAALVLFGGLLAWAVVTVVAINRSESWTPPPPAPPAREAMAVVGTVVVLGAIMGVHNWLGVQPWG